MGVVLCNLASVSGSKGQTPIVVPAGDKPVTKQL